MCVAVGNDSTVRLLLQRGASVQRPRALKHAIAHHRLELIELLAPGLTERSRDMYDFSPLRVAIESGNTATVQRVLSFPLMASEVNLVDANDGLVPWLRAQSWRSLACWSWLTPIPTAWMPPRA